MLRHAFQAPRVGVLQRVAASLSISQPAAALDLESSEARTRSAESWRWTVAAPTASTEAFRGGNGDVKSISATSEDQKIPFSAANPPKSVLPRILRHAATWRIRAGESSRSSRATYEACCSTPQRFAACYSARLCTMRETTAPAGLMNTPDKTGMAWRRGVGVRELRFRPCLGLDCVSTAALTRVVTPNCI